MLFQWTDNKILPHHDEDDDNQNIDDDHHEDPNEDKEPLFIEDHDDPDDNDDDLDEDLTVWCETDARLGREWLQWWRHGWYNPTNNPMMMII